MAIVKHPKSKYLWIDIWVGEGKNRRRIRKSSGTEDWNTAKILEQTYLSVHKKKTTRDRALEILNAVVPAEYSGLDIANAAAFYEICAKEDKLRISAKGLRDRLLDLRAFAVWAKDSSGVRFVSEVDAVVARAFRLQVATRGVSSKTVNNHIGNLGCAWNMFITRGKASTNPWSLVRMQRNEDEEETGRAFTRAEVARILEEARRAGHEWEPMTVFALYTGLRRGDCQTATWEQVDWENHLLLTKPSKTARKRIEVITPLHPKLEEALKGQIGKDPTWIFPFRVKHHSNRKTINGDVKFSEILARAGIEARDGEIVSFHSLRHTFITWLAEANVSQDVRMKLSGHTIIETHERYDHQVRPLVEAIRRLP